MKRFGLQLASLVVTCLGVSGSLACGDCYDENKSVEHVRHVKKGQPGASSAAYGPTKALEWGQVNFLHTTDTHGWLEGHLKEPNYGADWGDFVTFSEDMKRYADNKSVDLLIIDTGDLHDGTGLSDTTDPNGEISMKIFERLNYDLLTIGNHELLLAEVAYQTFNEISKFWGDRYLTSNVQIFDPATEKFSYTGQKYKYFTTKNGLRIMAFGILFDMTRNADVVRVTKAHDMVNEDWFLDAINSVMPVDLFLVLGHNPVRSSIGGTFGIIHEAIREAHPLTPIQIFGGHTHVRDFAVLDESCTALESGRYCETLGWVSMSGFNESNSGWKGVAPNPKSISNPTRMATTNSTSPFRYSRRYLDWNRATFDFHGPGKQVSEAGSLTTAEITMYRNQLRLSQVYGCTPQDFCINCAPSNSSNSVFPLLSQALAEVVVNETRKDIPRYVIANTGGIRLNIYKGPFTYDDFFTIMPSKNALLYIPEVPCNKADLLLGELNSGDSTWKQPKPKPKPNPDFMSFEFDLCEEPLMTGNETSKLLAFKGITKRQEVVDRVPGYTTIDDFGSDGDDTIHSPIPYYEVPQYYQGAGGFGTEGCTDVADVVFVDFAKRHILAILGPEYSNSDVTDYISPNYTIHDFLPEFVQRSEIFQASMPDCNLL